MSESWRIRGIASSGAPAEDGYTLDISTLKLPKVVPILHMHRGRRLGHGILRREGGELLLEGVVEWEGPYIDLNCALSVCYKPKPRIAPPATLKYCEVTEVSLVKAGSDPWAYVLSKRRIS